MLSHLIAMVTCARPQTKHRGPSFWKGDNAKMSGSIQPKNNNNKKKKKFRKIIAVVVAQQLN